MVCLQYLKWGVYAEKEDKDKFIEMALEWRKIEKRRGGVRSLIERRMRKLLRKWRKKKALAPTRAALSEFSKKTMEEGTGVWSEEYKKRHSEVAREIMRKRLAAGRSPSAKEWIVTEPDGTEVRIWNLHQYALSKGLDRGNLSQTARKNRGPHKGYRARLANNEWEGEGG